MTCPPPDRSHDPDADPAREQLCYECFGSGEVKHRGLGPPVTCPSCDGRGTYEWFDADYPQEP